MKSLLQYLKEEFATPTDTMGMGNPAIPDLPEQPGNLSDIAGSGDIIGQSKGPNKKRKKRKIDQNNSN